MRALIRGMSAETPLWGAPRIHGELLMLGIEVAESTVGKYMVRRRRPPSQGWKTFPQDYWREARDIPRSHVQAGSRSQAAYSHVQWLSDQARLHMYPCPGFCPAAALKFADLPYHQP